MRKLVIGEIYTERFLGKLQYMGRIGYELKERGIKGSNIFRILSWKSVMCTVWLTKKEIKELT